jgi:hypothetical protein
MEPAYNIPLGADDLRLIGEICAIQGMIEYSMQQIVRKLEGITQARARERLSAGGMGKNAEVFVGAMGAKCKNSALTKIAENAYKDILKTAKGRNDFVHAIFAANENDGFTLTFGFGVAPTPTADTVAIRTRNLKKTPASQIKSVRDAAARISCALAHVNHCLTTRRNDGQSPWLGKF